MSTCGNVAGGLAVFPELGGWDGRGFSRSHEPAVTASSTHAGMISLERNSSLQCTRQRSFVCEFQISSYWEAACNARYMYFQRLEETG